MLPLRPPSWPGTAFFSRPSTLVNRLNSPPFFLPLAAPSPDFMDDDSTEPSASASLLVHEIGNSGSASRAGVAWVGLNSASSEMVSQASVKDVGVEDAALVSEDKDDMLELDVRCMNAGRGGDSESRASRPSSLSCNSRLDVSASEASLSCEPNTDVCRRMLFGFGAVNEEIDLSELAEGEERRDGVPEVFSKELREDVE